MIEISEDSHTDLYYNLNKCLEFCKEIPDSKEEPATFHLYWNPLKVPFGKRHNLTLKSIIATQSKGSKIIFWSNTNLENNEWAKPLLPYVDFRILNLAEEYNKIPIDRRLNTEVYLSNFYEGSDVIRYILFYNYGGVWIDCDVLLLRNLNPFLQQEWAYKWQVSKSINAATSHFKKGSDTSLSLIKELFITPMKHIASFSMDLLTNVYNRDRSFSVFPCGFFDPCWLNGENDFFDNNSSFNMELYDGAFAVHLHNNWQATATSNCRFEKYERLIEEKFNAIL